MWMGLEAPVRCSSDVIRAGSIYRHLQSSNTESVNRDKQYKW